MNLITISKSVSVLIIMSFLSLVACDGNKFETLQNEKCFAANHNPNTSGEFTEEGTCLYKHFYKTGKLDVVFIIDNSKSMYQDQLKLAERFPQFISLIWSLDFKLAIMTTDIYKAPVSNGQFVTLSNGQTSISNTGRLSQNEVNQIFTDSITRKETLSCELNQGNCPTHDVRGIYAANLAVTRNKAFFRPDAHIAFVVLSDADVRVFGGGFNQYKLDQNWDTASSLVRNLSSLGSDKTMSVHSIIINPGSDGEGNYYMEQDVACLQEQSNQGDQVRGYYGTQYFKLSMPNSELQSKGNILRGSVGSICARDYSNILQNISNSTKNNLKTIGLRCADPLHVDIYYTDNQENKIPFHIDGSKIVLDRDLNVGSKVTVEMECPNIH